MRGFIIETGKWYATARNQRIRAAIALQMCDLNQIKSPCVWFLRGFWDKVCEFQVGNVECFKKKLGLFTFQQHCGICDVMLPSLQNMHRRHGIRRKKVPSMNKGKWLKRVIHFNRAQKLMKKYIHTHKHQIKISRYLHNHHSTHTFWETLGNKKSSEQHTECAFKGFSTTWTL